MKNKMKLVALLMLSIVSLTACGLIPPQKEERYVNIDEVLTLIDYKTIGPILKEEVDTGDGVFAPSYKSIYYSEKSFYEIDSRLKVISDSCNGGIKTKSLYCIYSRVSISVSYNDFNEIVVKTTDSSNGQDRKGE